MVYEIVCKNIVESGRPQLPISHVLCMLDNSGYKHTLTICNMYCFSTVQWPHECASMLRYTYIACVLFKNENSA